MDSSQGPVAQGSEGFDASGSPPFGATVTVGSDETILRICGELDLLTAPAFRGFMDLALSHGRRHLVLDLHQLAFMDGSALRVIDSSLERLESLQGELTLRSPSPMVVKMLEITGLIDRVRREAPRAAIAAPQGSRSRPLMGDLLWLETRRAKEGVLQATLQLLVSLVRVAIPDADGVSVSMASEEGLRTVASTDEVVEAMDADQYATGEGPCITAATEGRGVQVSAVPEETRWPSFIPRAQERGIMAIVSSPLLAGDRPVGALNIYSRTADAFWGRGQQLASQFAERASIVVTHARADTVEDRGRTLREALGAREVIAQAQGALMVREGISPDEAHAVLRYLSRQTETTLLQQAQQIVASTQSSGEEKIR